MSAPLPPLLVVTDGHGTGGRPLIDVVTAAISGGARAVLLREKHRSHAERAELALHLRAVLSKSHINPTNSGRRRLSIEETCSF